MLLEKKMKGRGMKRGICRLFSSKAFRKKDRLREGERVKTEGKEKTVSSF